MNYSIEARIQTALKTYQATGSKAAAVSSFVFPSSMSWQGSRGSFLSLAPRSGLPYRTTDPLENSAVVATLSWITRNFGQAEFQVARQKRDGSEEPITNHPLQQLLERPNAFYTGQALWSATEFSYHLDGNAYWFKERNARGFGIPTALWYIPHWMIKACRPQDGSQFISHYEYTADGIMTKFPVENVVHFRNGINPSDTRYGFAPLRAAMLQVFSDIEVDSWVAALCYNQAMPGTIIAPKGNTAIGLGEEKAKTIKEAWKRRFGGDNRGDVGVLDFEAEITQLGYDPSQMDFSAIHMHAETRITGCLGVPAIVAGLSAGLDASTYNNMDGLKKSAFEERLVADWEAFEDTLDAQLLPDFEQDPMARGIFCEFDTSNVRALKEDQNEKEARARDNLKAGGILIDEFRADCGLPPLPNGAGQVLLLPTNARPATPENVAARAAQEIIDPKQTPPGESDAGGNSGQPPPKALPAFTPPQPQVIVIRTEHSPGVVVDLAKSTKAIEWEGLMLRREPTDLEKLCVKSIDNAMATGQQNLAGFLSIIRQRWFEELAAEYDSGELDDPTDLQNAQPTIKDNDLSGLATLLLSLFATGAKLIVTELNQQGASLNGVLAQSSHSELATLTSATITKLANDVRARAVASAVAAVQLGLRIADKIRTDARDGSTGYVSRAAGEATNLALARGRDAEIAARSGEIQFLVYSAVLDANSCRPCGDADGLTGQKSELPSVPNPACEGGASCRCVLIAVRKVEG